MRRSLALALLLAVVLSLAFALPAYADRPVVTVWPYPSVHLEAGWPCSFPVTLVYQGNTRETAWLNEAGQVVRGLWNAQDLTVYWSANGRTVPVNSVSGLHYTVVHDAEGSEWTYACRGPDSFSVMPGIGPITGGAGLMTWTVRCPGYTECVLDPGIAWENFTRIGLEVWDTAVLCAALAP